MIRRWSTHDLAAIGALILIAIVSSTVYIVNRYQITLEDIANYNLPLDQTLAMRLSNTAIGLDFGLNDPVNRVLLGVSSGTIILLSLILITAYIYGRKNKKN